MFGVFYTSKISLTIISEHFLHLNKMPFCLPTVYNCLWGGCVSVWSFSPPFSQISIEADHLALSFPFRRVASTKLIVFMYVNRF